LFNINFLTVFHQSKFVLELVAFTIRCFFTYELMLRSPLRTLLILLMVIILIDFTLRIEHCYPEL